MQRLLFLLLAGLLMWGALLLPRGPLDAGTVVTKDLDAVSGQEDRQSFYQAVQAGRFASIHLTGYHLADEWRPENVVYEEMLVFDGEVYTISGPTGGDDNGPWEYAYQYLMYFPDVPSPSPTSRFESSTHYVLADDGTLTWNDIWRSMISSNTKDRIRHNIVYSEYKWRE